MVFFLTKIEGAHRRIWTESSKGDGLSNIIFNLCYHQEDHNCGSHHYCLIVPLLIICKQADWGEEGWKMRQI